MPVHQSERQCHIGRFPCSLLFSPQFVIVGQVFLSENVLKCSSVGFFPKHLDFFEVTFSNFLPLHSAFASFCVEVVCSLYFKISYLKSQKEI